MNFEKILKTTFQIPIILKYGYLLESNKYQQLETICKKRLMKRENDFIALFYLMYSKSYQKAFEDARKYFFKMFTLEVLSKKTKNHFLNVIVRDQLSKKRYKQTIDDCQTLLKKENDGYIKKILLRVLCECNYYLRNFHEVLSLCIKLKESYPEEEIIKFTDAYIEAINKEQGKTDKRDNNISF